MNERNQTNDLHSLSHTKWNCKYHVVFAPKYRRIVFYDSKRIEIGKILRELCEWKGVNIIEAEVCKDHVHMLVEIPPKMSISGFMGFLKGKSSQMIYEIYRQVGDLAFEIETKYYDGFSRVVMLEYVTYLTSKMQFSIGINRK